MPASARSARCCAVALLLALLVGTTVSAAAEETEQRIAFAFTDRAITESSGLVARGPLVFTVNDSGADPQVYAVNRSTGDTVMVTTYSSDVVDDVEALAPGLGGDIWVGDIGDNNEDRSSISVQRVVPLGGLDQQLEAQQDEGQQNGAATGEESVEAEKFDLVYPDSAHDAEALLVHPVTGRLYMVSKAATGGTVYAAPKRLDPEAANRLEVVGQVPGLVTDGSFTPDGEHIMLRSYGRGAVYDFADLRPVANVDLPSQQQGEGLAIGRGGQIYLSSEGAYSEVLQIRLPAEALDAIGDSALEAKLPTTPPERSSTAEPQTLSTGDGTGLWVAGGVLVITVAGWLAFTVARRRSRRSR